MAFLKTGRLLAGTALGLLVALSAPAMAAETKPATEVAAVNFDAATVDTFAGAFLAASTADNDYDYPTAITLYRTALKYEPDNSSVRQRLMVSLFMNGDFDEGVVEAEKLKDEPSVERIATIARGIEAVRKKQFPEAYKILKYNGPNELDRMINTLIASWGQFGEGKPKDALKTIADMKGPEWYSVFLNYNAGMIAAASGDLDTARSKLTETITNREEGAAAYDTYMRAVVALASLEAKAGNHQKALDAVSLGEAFAPNYVPLQSFRKKIEAGEKPELAIKDAVQGISGVLFSVGGALNQSVGNAPDRQSAQEIVAFYLVTAYALDPSSSDAAVLLGGLAENLDQADRAIAWYKKVPADSPLRRISDLQLGLNLANTGKVEEARQHLQAAIAAEPGDIRGYIAMGSLLSDAKDYQAMAKNFDTAVNIIGPLPKRNDWSVFFQRAIAYERLKQWQMAEPNFKKALELYPDQPQVLNYLGYSWVDMNINLDEGLNMIRKAVDLKPDDGYIVDSLGWAYFRMNRFDDAVGELERAVELKAADSTINDHLGDAYWRVGRKLEAIFQWRTALSVKPEAGEIPKIEKKIREGLPPLEIKKAANEPADANRTVDVAAADPVKEAADEVKPLDTMVKPVVKPADTEAKPADAVAKPVEPVAEPSVIDGSHTVAKGDSLWDIAKDVLGDGMRYHELISLNPELKRHPDRLQPGQMIKLPGAKN